MKTIFSKRIFLSIIFSVAITYACIAQTDTIVLNNQKIACTVKEITPDAVKYSYPGEDLLNSVYKNGVQKIIFKSGRVQTFAESTSYKPVNGVMDYNNVTITSVESEVKGLFKLGDVSSKAKGTTTFSNQERVKERAYRKFKIQAAMLGANIIYLTNQRTEGNKYGYYNSSASEANLTGIAYSNTLPDLDNFKKLLGSRANFVAVKQYKLWSSDSDVSQDAINKRFTIANVINDNGIVSIEGTLEGESKITSFQLASFDSNGFSVAFKDKETAYNIVIKF